VRQHSNMPVGCVSCAYTASERQKHTPCLFDLQGLALLMMDLRTEQDMMCMVDGLRMLMSLHAFAVYCMLCTGSCQGPVDLVSACNHRMMQDGLLLACRASQALQSMRRNTGDAFHTVARYLPSDLHWLLLCLPPAASLVKAGHWPQMGLVCCLLVELCQSYFQPVWMQGGCITTCSCCCSACPTALLQHPSLQPGIGRRWDCSVVCLLSCARATFSQFRCRAIA
jgi:hypothetical protein